MESNGTQAKMQSDYIKIELLQLAQPIDRKTKAP